MSDADAKEEEGSESARSSASRARRWTIVRAREIERIARADGSPEFDAVYILHDAH
jgi:hypothetical protein